MGEAESKKKKVKNQQEPSREQYEMLMRCSEKKDITEWNEWRLNNPNSDIWLKDAPMSKFYLCGAYLCADTEIGNIPLQGNVHLSGAHLEGAELGAAHLERAKLFFAHLEGASLLGAHMKGAELFCADLEGVDFSGADLRSADFSRVAVDGRTLIWQCKIDRNTKFEGVALGNMRIYPKEKQLLEYNIRRMNWKEWYGEHPRLKMLVKPFWWVSDYGLSTVRIIITFFGLAFIFANIYYHWARLALPGIVSNLLVDSEGLPVAWWLVPLRTLYFSIVTMTTLGFGDMYAKGQSFFGHLLLMLQVLLGYVLLAALVTRFAVLFTAGGPAGKFADKKEKED